MLLLPFLADLDFTPLWIEKARSCPALPFSALIALAKQLNLWQAIALLAVPLSLGIRKRAAALEASVEAR